MVSAAALLAPGCTSDSHPAANATSSSSAPPSIPCRTQDLAAAGSGQFSASGHGIAIVVIANVTNTACAVSGFPVVTLDLDGDAPVRGAVAATGGYILSDKPPSQILLVPGGAAFFGIASEHNCQPITALPARKNFATVSLNESGQGLHTPIEVSLCNDGASVGPFRGSWRDVSG